MNTTELVAAFLESRRQMHCRPATVNTYRWLLTSWGRLALEEPAKQDVERWLASAPSAESARTWRRHLLAMYHWAEEEFDLPNPARRVKAPPKRKLLPRVFTEGELRMIRSAARDPRDAAAVSVMVDTGLRIGQLVSIRWERVEVVPATRSHEPGYAVTVDGKTGDHRVPMTIDAYRALQRIAEGPGPVFRAANGKPLAVATVNLRVRNVISAAGVRGRKTGPHTFRHTFATLYLRGGGDIYRLQRILGHSSINQTLVYLHLSDPEAFEEHARLSPLRRLGAPQQLQFEEAANG